MSVKNVAEKRYQEVTHLDKEIIWNELEEIKGRFDKLENMVEKLTDNTNKVLENQNSIKFSRKNKHEKKVVEKVIPQPNDEVLNTISTILNKTKTNVDVYDRYVRVAGKYIRKISENKKGKYFVFGPDTVYLDLNNKESKNAKDTKETNTNKKAH